jgi:hypothetical protein
MERTVKIIFVQKQMLLHVIFCTNSISIPAINSFAQNTLNHFRSSLAKLLFTCPKVSPYRPQLLDACSKLDETNTK